MIPGDKVSLTGLTKEQVDRELEAALEGAPAEEVEELLLKALSEFRTGRMVQGRILGIQGEEVVVDVGYKSEGFVPLREFEKPEDIKPGENLQVYVDGVEAEAGAVVLSKRKADRIRNWERVIANHVVGDVVTGRVMRKIKGGLLVDIGVPAFLPASQIDMRRVGDVGEYIGQTLTAKIIKIDEDRRNIVISRRKLLEDERERLKKKLLAEIQRGEVRRGVVKNLTDFGAFVDLGGIDGLLHITDMSWGRISHPSELLKPEQTIEVKVLDFDLDRERISLGYKQLQANPWSNVRGKYPIGTKVSGEVVTLQPYGAFVKIEDGVEGLVHVSEMSWGRQVNHPSEVVKVGDSVDVVVLSIDEDRQEISLGLKQAAGDPWTDVEAKFPVGTKVKGNVRNLTGYGAFIELSEGVDGLLHVSDMSWTKKVNHPSALLKKGDEVEAVVLSVDSERKRVALGVKQLTEDPWESHIPTQYRPGTRVKGKVTKLASFGAFVEIEEGLEGLLHVSEISDKKIEKPEDALEMGQELELTVINVDPKERKIGLSLKAAQMPEEEAEEKYDFASYADAGPGGATLGAVAGGALEELAARAEAREAEAASKAEASAAEEKPEEPEAPAAEEEKPEEPAEEKAEAPEAPAEEEKSEEPAEEKADEPEAPRAAAAWQLVRA
ncbi:MAG: 30S ribosomal protein S1 [Planctomycetota bacterium]|jgi:small subunit ribosomal protein S1